MSKKVNISYSGSIPPNYEKFLGSIYFEPYAITMADKIAERSPKNILELACGTGRLTRKLALQKDVRIVATDISASMLAHAESITDATNVAWAIADAVALDYPADSFDCVAAQFGVMFFSDKIKAYTSARQILKEDGFFMFCCWNKLSANPIAFLTHEMIKEFIPIDTPVFYEVPFAYHNTNLIREELETAEFKNIRIELVKHTGYAPSASDAAMGLLEGTPAYSAIMERDPSLIEPMKKRLIEKLEHEFGSEEIHPTLEAFIVTATK
jgi:ubiquinone/menaquinone biosynthesis C-methylase UbiE